MLSKQNKATTILHNYYYYFIFFRNNPSTQWESVDWSSDMNSSSTFTTILLCHVYHKFACELSLNGVFVFPIVLICCCDLFSLPMSFHRIRRHIWMKKKKQTCIMHTSWNCRKKMKQSLFPGCYCSVQAGMHIRTLFPLFFRILLWAIIIADSKTIDES